MEQLIGDKAWKLYPVKLQADSFEPILLERNNLVVIALKNKNHTILRCFTMYNMKECKRVFIDIDIYQIKYFPEKNILALKAKSSLLLLDVSQSFKQFLKIPLDQSVVGFELILPYDKVVVLHFRGFTCTFNIKRPHEKEVIFNGSVAIQNFVYDKEMDLLIGIHLEGLVLYSFKLKKNVKRFYFPQSGLISYCPKTKILVTRSSDSFSLLSKHYWQIKPADIIPLSQYKSKEKWKEMQFVALTNQHAVYICESAGDFSEAEIVIDDIKTTMTVERRPILGINPDKEVIIDYICKIGAFICKNISLDTVCLVSGRILNPFQKILQSKNVIEETIPVQTKKSLISAKCTLF